MDRFKVRAALSLVATLGVLSVAGAHAGESREASDGGAATGARAGTAGPCTPGSGRPKVVQVSYARWYGGNELDANARRTDRLTMSTRYRGRRAAAPLRRRNIFDGDLNGEASVVWKTIKEKGGKRLFRLVRKALEGERGMARVRTRAKRCGRIDKDRWTFRYSECRVSSDPSYPIYCELKPRGPA